MGEILVRAEAEYFITRKVIQATNGYQFALPSDSHSILRVWDLGTNAITVTGAANSGGLVRITAVAHGFETDDVVTIHDVAGATQANGTWKVTKITANTFDLQG
jgi:hypothetical protein